MTTFTEAFHAGGYVVSEANGTRSRKQITIKSSAALKAGTVLGRISVATSAPTYAANAGNTGNFTSSAVTESAGAVAGVYRIEFRAATVFDVFDPSGELVGQGKTGVAFAAGGLGFTLTAGGTAAVAGDGGTITVAASASADKYIAHDAAATDGSQIAAAILYADADASAADAVATAHVRDMEYNASEIIWKTGISDNNRNAGIAALAALGMIGL